MYVNPWHPSPSLLSSSLLFSVFYSVLLLSPFLLNFLPHSSPKVLTEAEYKSWYEERHEAEIALEDRSSLLSKSTHSIENQLTLLGATGIEDRLQAGVPTAIASLQAAGMKVWVLTGDKQETAINIGYSSCLIQSGMEVVVLNAYSMVSACLVVHRMGWSNCMLFFFFWFFVFDFQKYREGLS